jgi:hypothetical protein
MNAGHYPCMSDEESVTPESIKLFLHQPYDFPYGVETD